MSEMEHESVADEDLGAVVEENIESAPEESEEQRERRLAALASVRQMGDPVLRTRALAVTRFDARLREEIEYLRGVMDGALGVGLAANQVGSLQRLLVYRVEPDSPIVALINPSYEWQGDELEMGEEGCLSIPGIHVDVERHVHVRVRGADEFGAAQVIEASGLEARVIQHEVDHLDGVLILDRTSREQRREAMRAWRDGER